MLCNDYMQNFRSLESKTKKFIIRGILVTTVSNFVFWTPESNAGLQNTPNKKLFCFWSEWPEILHVVIIWNLSTFIFYEIFCAEKFLLMKLFSVFSFLKFFSMGSAGWPA